MKNKKINITLLLPIPPKTDLKKLRFKFYRDNKTYSVKARFTFSEYQKITQNLQIPVAVFVRNAALQNIITRRINPPKVDPKLNQQLAFIGNNLNQLTRLAHLDNKKNDLDVMLLISQLSDINEQLTAIRSHYSINEATQ